MKKLLFLLILLPVAVIAQQDTTAVIPVPGGIIDIFADLQGWFASTAAVAGVTIFLTLMVAKVWKTITAIWKQIVALAIALVLIIVGNLANIGFMADFNWVSTIVYGLITGFIANGWYDLKNVTK